MKQIFTLLVTFVLSAIAVTSFSQTCGTGVTFTPASTNTFPTTAENFTGDFYWSATGSGELISTEASVGQIKKLMTSKYTLPMSATTLRWSFKLAGTMNVQSYSVIAYYKSGATVMTVPVCSGGSLTTIGNYHYFNATSPAQILGQEFQLEITFNSTTTGSKVLNVDDFSTNGFSSNIALPIKLISFQGSLNNNKAAFTWSVADNETGNHFEIERSEDGRSFSSEAVIFTTNKIALENYNYSSPSTLNNQTYYRLKISNKDGSIAYSKTIGLKAQVAGNSNSVVIPQNPVDATLMFQYTAKKANKSTVNIYNIGGAKMLTTAVAVQAGLNSVSINLDGKFNSGTYILEVINGTERSTTKLIKK